MGSFVTIFYKKDGMDGFDDCMRFRSEDLNLDMYKASKSVEKKD